ncbi:polysaccharide deacetylase family protein [Rubritalea marina]|uniref:polysaccharide deacetylase family protein n=1 Tax=Rubritalea marina TaxID=361055 RepID=UPI0014614E77|nr:polysaccharide deacetylase family protein [Rubritalea marina]
MCITQTLRYGLMVTSMFFLASCGKDKQPEQAAIDPIVSNNTKKKKSKSQWYTGKAQWNESSNGLSNDISGNRQVSFSYGNRNSKNIAITFDDGPHPTLTPKLLDILKARNVKATFYVLGPLVEKHPELTRRILREGHELGNHTWTHPDMSKMGANSVRNELQRTEDTIVRVTGVKPQTMRPPYGAFRSEQKKWVFAEFGYPTILWDVDPNDWRRPGSQVVARRLINGARGGSILLAHDIHSGTIAAMPMTLDSLINQGYKFVTVSQLIAQSNTATAGY